MTSLLRSSARRPVRTWLIGALVVAVVVATGSVLVARGTSAASPPTAAPNAAAAGQSTPTTVTTLAGNTMRVPGAKPTALLFFSVGCGECAGAAKSLAQAAHTVGGTAEVLAVDMDPSESAADITGFLTSIDAAGLPAAIDTGAALTQRFGISAVSTLIVIDPAGKLTYRATDPDPGAITTALDQARAR